MLMAMIAANNGNSRNGTGGLAEPLWLRLVLISSTLLFLGLFLVLPLIVVFTEAFKKGVEVYIESVREPDAAAAGHRLRNASIAGIRGEDEQLESILSTENADEAMMMPAGRRRHDREPEPLTLPRCP